MTTENLLPEVEAKKKQCRQAVHVVPMGHAIAWAFPNCSGAECAHWRWGTPSATATRGYCGLAGTP